MSNATNPFLATNTSISKRLIDEDADRKLTTSIAKVTAVNSDPVSVDIQPLIQQWYTAAGWQTMPEIKQVPISLPCSNEFSFRFPVNIGDVGVVVWFHRDAWSWLNSPSEAPSQPDSGDTNDYFSCCFFPFMQKFSNQYELKQSGVDFLSSGVSLLTQMIAIVDTMVSDLSNKLQTLAPLPVAVTVAGAPGTGTADVTQINLISTSLTPALENIKSQLETFKGQQ